MKMVYEVEYRAIKEVATRRLELLRRIPEFVWNFEQESLFCPICGANAIQGHLSDCELAKELEDAVGGES